MRNWDYAYGVSNSKGSDVIGKVGVVPLPTFAGQPQPGYSNIGGWNLYINPHSKNLTADLNFIKCMSGTQAQTIEAKPPFSADPDQRGRTVQPGVGPQMHPVRHPVPDEAGAQARPDAGLRQGHRLFTAT